MSGRASKRKGGRVERLACKVFNGLGEAKRIPLSGAIADWKGDISIDIQGRKFVAEVKARRGGWKQIDKWIGEHDMLMVKPDYQDFYIIFTEKSFREFVNSLVPDPEDMI